jgi:L-threonylcarbamoyladenylate synthase
MRGTRRLAVGPDAIAEAAAVLEAGGLVAFPTETVYGLGARADRAEAVRGIFAAKGRPPTNPLIVHVAGVAAARALAADWPIAAERLALAFWPGPLTLVVSRRPGVVVDEVTAGGDTVAVRVPSHPVARALLEACRLPIAAPSANRSARISPVTAEHVLKGLDGRIDVVLDGGRTPRGIESTIVDVTRAPAVVLRHGAVPLGAVEGIVAVVDRAAAVTREGERADAPGSQERHYAPKAHVVLAVAGAADAEADARRAAGERVGVIVRGPERPARGAVGLRVALPEDAPGYAAGLYAALHQLDDAACDAIVVEAVPDDPAWAAVRDRLRRASA